MLSLSRLPMLSAALFSSLTLLQQLSADAGSGAGSAVLLAQQD